MFGILYAPATTDTSIVMSAQESNTSKLPLYLLIGCGVLLLLIGACGIAAGIAVPSFMRYKALAEQSQ